MSRSNHFPWLHFGGTFLPLQYHCRPPWFRAHQRGIWRSNRSTGHIEACVRHLEALKQHDLDLPNVPHVWLYIHRISPKTRSVAELEDPVVLGDATPAVQSHTPAVPRGRTECEGSIGKGMRPNRGSLRPGSPGPEVLYPGERNHPLKEQVPV